MAEVIIVKNQEEAGELYGRSVADLIKAKPNAVLGLATGSSPLAAYQALAKIVEEESIDVSMTVWMISRRRASVLNATSPEEPSVNRPSTPASIMRLSERAKLTLSTSPSAVSGVTTGGMTPRNCVAMMVVPLQNQVIRIMVGHCRRPR